MPREDNVWDCGESENGKIRENNDLSKNETIISVLHQQITISKSDFNTSINEPEGREQTVVVLCKKGATGLIGKQCIGAIYV